MNTNAQESEHDLDSGGGHPLTWLVFAVLFTAVCGLVYPILTAFLGGALFPAQANGSLIEQNGRVIGSSLVGQAFSGEGYFIGRPSSAGNGYDPMNLSGSNLATSNPALPARAKAASLEVAEREGVTPDRIPVDLIAASGSGVDPHISPEAAEVQVERVARARGLSPEGVREIVQKNTEGPTLGVLGQARVNVLRLNLALDAAR